MGVGTKNRQLQNAEACKQHLREKHAGQGALVEEFIEEIEGRESDHTRWSQFADAKRSRAEMMERVDQHFEKWLNPSA
jgi:hypothetical protein